VALTISLLKVLGGLVGIHPKDLASLRASGLTDEVIAERGYYSADQGASEITPKLASLGVKWASRTREALVIPMYGPKGDLVSAQIRLRELPPINGKKPLRYLNASGMPQKLDVHPRNVSRISDVSSRLWITEGVKKGDALTVHGEVAISLAGIYTWRNKMGTLGDWEDVPLRGRQVIVCFDSDAHEKRDVLLAMKRLGRWLTSKGARTYYLITPEVEGLDKTGADDFLARGGTISDLIAKATDSEPVTTTSDGKFSDAFMAERVAEEVMTDRFRWSAGTGWITWDGRKWSRCDDETVIEAARLWAVDRFAQAVNDTKGDNTRSRQEVIDGWRSVLGKARLNSIVSLTKGIVIFDAAEMDADPDVLNCRNGVIDLRTGELMSHDPARLISKICEAEYDPEADHDDWKAALEALPEDVRDWFQIRIGQAATGYMTPDDVLCVLHGGGSNGKTTIMAAIGKALGSYHVVASDRILLGQAVRDETMELMGARFALIEETPEAGRLDVVRLKKTVGTPQMKGHHLYQSEMTWDATHSLFVTSNYRPQVAETDTGTWRRLALVTFPYRYTSNPEAPHERKGDGTLRQRIKQDPEILKAVLRWIVEGAMKFYEANMVMPEHPATVIEDTRAWRAASDMILSFWDDQLEADADAHVMSADLFTHFRSWMEAQGNRPWSEKVFTARFADHSETVSARVEKKKVRRDSPSAGRLSRPIGTGGTTPGSYQAWLGVRFREDDDPLS